MKRTLILALPFLLVTATAMAQDRRHYDAQGREQGRSSTTRQHLDERRIPQGTSRTTGDTTRHLDQRGILQGRSVQGADGTVRHYDSNGRLTGTTRTR